MQKPHSGINVSFKIAVLFLLTSLSVENIFAEQQWRSVFVDGIKVGHGFYERKAGNGTIITNETLSLKTKQPDTYSTLLIELETEERVDGSPLRFRKHVKAGKMDTVIEGRFQSGQVSIHTNFNGIEESSIVPLRTPVLFPEAQRNKLVAGNLSEGTQISFNVFDFSSLQPVSSQILIHDFETLQLMGKSIRLRKVLQKTLYPGNRQSEITVFYDDRFIPQRMISGILGIPAVIESSDESDALSPDEPFDHLARQLIKSPYILNRKALRGAIRYKLQTLDGTPLRLPETYEQHVRQSGSTVEIDVCRKCGREAPPSEEALQTYLRANPWMQSDHPELQELAARAVGETDSPRERMKKLTRLVKRRMHGKIYFIGYGSALEAARTGHGDCTEYALLLAALGRSANIPTRVVSGLVYSEERFHGRKWRFVPHAWVQAWVDNRWESFDAALGNFNAGHIAFGVGHGDQPGFAAAMHVVDNIRIASAAMLIKPGSKGSAGAKD